MEVRRLVSVDLVDVLFFEKARITQVAAARREVSRAADIYAVAVRGHAVKYIPVEDVSEFAGVDCVFLAAPEPVLILT